MCLYEVFLSRPHSARDSDRTQSVRNNVPAAVNWRQRLGLLPRRPARTASGVTAVRQTEQNGDQDSEGWQEGVCKESKSWYRGIEWNWSRLRESRHNSGWRVTSEGVWPSGVRRGFHPVRSTRELQAVAACTFQSRSATGPGSEASSSRAFRFTRRQAIAPVTTRTTISTCLTTSAGTCPLPAAFAHSKRV